MDIHGTVKAMFKLVTEVCSCRLYIVGHLARIRCRHRAAMEDQCILGKHPRNRLASLLQLSKACQEGSIFYLKLQSYNKNRGAVVV